MSTEHATTKFDDKFDSGLLDLELAIDFYIFNIQSKDKLRLTIFKLVENLNQLPTEKNDQITLLRLQELSRRLWSAGYHENPVPEEDLKWAYKASKSGWRGLIGAMLVSPAWQWTEGLPNLSTVPDWLLNSYIDWIFVSPCITNTTGAIDLHITKLETIAEQLNLLTNRKKISISTKAAVALFLRNSETANPQISPLPIRRWSETRSSIAERFYRNSENNKPPPVALPIDGRALNIGVILPNWGDTLTTRGIWPRISSLDPSSFNVHLFAERGLGDKFEKHCRNSVSKFQILPHNFNARADMLHGANLDVLIFGGTLSNDSDLRLGLHRFAPLQVATDTCIGTTGLSGIDLHLSALPDAYSEFVEPIAKIPEPSFVWDSETASVPFETLSRITLGLPSEGVVYVTSTSLETLSADNLLAWTKLIESDLSSSLLLLLPADSDLFKLEQIFEKLQAAIGLSAKRIVIFLCDPREALPVGDIYLDTYPCSNPTSLLAAIDAGLPAVTWEGATHRSRYGSHILRKFGQQEWIASDSSGYIARALSLSQNTNLRNLTRQNLANKIESNRGLGDSPLASLHFGTIIKFAYSEVLIKNRIDKSICAETPRHTQEALTEVVNEALNTKNSTAARTAAMELLQANPESTTARSLLGRAYLQAGMNESAMACFFSALRGREKEAYPWIDVGAGLSAKGEIGAAIKAYETALKIDETLIDGWIAIADLARKNGEYNLALEASAIAQRLYANDPRLSYMTASIKYLSDK